MPRIAAEGTLPALAFLPDLSGSRVWPWFVRNWRWFVAGAVVLLVLSLFAPGLTYYWNFWGFKALFRDDFGFGNAWATVMAIPCAFVYVIILPIALRWSFFGRRRVRALLALFVVYGSTPLLHALLDTNFNQATGQAQKCYVFRPGGDIVLTDTCGFDPTTGAHKQPLTPEVARVIERRKKGLYPKAIAEDPRTLKFFDPVTGDARVWYAKRPGGGYALFDAEGFDEATRELL